MTKIRISRNLFKNTFLLHFENVQKRKRWWINDVPVARSWLCGFSLSCLQIRLPMYSLASQHTMEAALLCVGQIILYYCDVELSTWILCNCSVSCISITLPSLPAATHLKNRSKNRNVGQTLFSCVVSRSSHCANHHHYCTSCGCFVFKKKKRMPFFIVAEYYCLFYAL